MMAASVLSSRDRRDEGRQRGEKTFGKLGEVGIQGELCSRSSIFGTVV